MLFRSYHGQGTYTHPDGKKYEGEYKDGKFHGQGTYTWSDGTKYLGEWKDGVFHGQGTLTSQDGKKEVGVWRESQPWNSIEYDKNGNTIGKWVNGKLY